MWLRVVEGLFELKQLMEKPRDYMFDVVAGRLMDYVTVKLAGRLSALFEAAEWTWAKEPVDLRSGRKEAELQSQVLIDRPVVVPLMRADAPASAGVVDLKLEQFLM